MYAVKHIALIMDGNRRWAKRHALETFLGHQKGASVLEPLVAHLVAKQVSVMTFWCLSKENITSRSPQELSYLFSLFQEMVHALLPRFIEQGVRLETIGDLSLLPEDFRAVLAESITATAQGTAASCVLALAYSGQDEIVRATKACLRAGVDPDTLTEQAFARYLDSGKYPPPDLIIRTGGDQRHSGFLLYQSAYSEYVFTPTLWPDFTTQELDTLLQDFSTRERRFGW